jgi:hypothetical protein
MTNERLRPAVAGLRRGERGIAVVAGVSPAADKYSRHGCLYSH